MESIEKNNIFCCTDFIHIKINYQKKKKKKMASLALLGVILNFRVAPQRNAQITIIDKSRKKKTVSHLIMYVGLVWCRLEFSI